MFVIYFKNYCAIFIEQIFCLQVISAKCEDWSKALSINISAWRPKMKNKGILFSVTSKV